MENDIAIGDFSLESIGKEVASNIKNNVVYHASPIKADKLLGKKTGSWSGEQGEVVSDEDAIKRHGDATPLVAGKESMEESKRLHGGIYKSKVIVKDSKVFADENIAAETYVGILFSYDINEKEPKELDLKRDIRVSKFGSLIGHSSTPNCVLEEDINWSNETPWIKTHDIECKAKTAIKAGDELTINYNAIQQKYGKISTFSIGQESMLNEDSYASFMEEGMQLLDEFHCGCKEFSDWVTKLELMQLHNTTTDTGLKQLSYSLAQENIMTDTVKDIFRRIGQFIGWFWSKLKQLWNFFFGKVQRSIRLFKANLEKIKAHNASGKFINLEAFKKAQAPNTLLPGITLLTILEDWDPDPFYSAFEQCYDKFRTNIVELHDWFARIMDPSSPVNVFLKAGYGSGANKATGNKGTDLISDYLACGHHCKGSFEQESYVDIDVIFGLSEMIEHVIESYKKNAKLIDSKGVSGYEASRIITNLEDRADLTQTEAADLASKVQKLAGCMSVATDRYQKCFAKILEQGIILQTAYMKFMQ